MIYRRLLGLEIQLMGCNVHYKIEGAGQDVLILHGWGANMDTVEPIFQLCRRNFRTCSIDLPGFGKSGKPPADWDVYSYAEFVKAFAQQVEIHNPVLIGHSFGGRLSIILSGKQMMGIHKIILVDSAGILPKRGIGYYARVYTYKAAKKVAGAIGKLSSSMENAIKEKFGSSDYKNADPLMRTIMVRVVNEDLTYLLPSIKQSTLLIWGALDDATPLSDAKQMEQRIPDAGLVVFEQAGHYSYLDNYGQFCAVVNKFLENDMQEVPK